MRQICVYLLALLLMLDAGGWLRAQEADDPCPGRPVAGLAAGGSARVLVDDGIGLALREGPSLAAGVLAPLVEGSPVMLLESTGCAEGLRWWQVRLPDARVGFVPETEGEGAALLEAQALEAHLFLPVEGELAHYVLPFGGELHLRGSLPAAPRSDSAETLWQDFELAAANAALAAAQAANLPLPPALEGAANLNSLPLNDRREFFPAPDGSGGLLLRHFWLELPTAAGQMVQYGTSYVSRLSAAGEVSLLPYSQHSEPPPSHFCQPPDSPAPEQQTRLTGLAWSADALLVALAVRYLGTQAGSPCSFHHLFMLNTQTGSVQHVGEGQRPFWRGHTLYFFRPAAETGAWQLWRQGATGEALALALPSGANWLPPALQDREEVLPQAEDLLLACGMDCSTIRAFRMEGNALSAAFPTPPGALPGATLHLMMGETHVLWHSAGGRLFLQSLANGAMQPIEVAGAVQQVLALPYGVGALLEMADGGYHYLDPYSRELRELVGVP